MSASDAQVHEDAERDRYTISVGARVVGVVEYADHDGARVITHTEVEDGHEGEGLGSALVRGVLDDVGTRGLDIVPLCPFVAGWLERHPERNDVVADDPERIARSFARRPGPD